MFAQRSLQPKYWSRSLHHHILVSCILNRPVIEFLREFQFILKFLHFFLRNEMLDDQVNELKFLGDSSVLFLENFLLTQTILMDFIGLLARIFDTFHDTVQFSCLSFDLFLLGLIPLLNLYLLRFLLFQLLLFTSFLLLTFLEFDLHLHQLLLLLSLLLFVFIPLNNLTLHFLYLLQCLFLLFFLPRYFFIFFT